MALELQTGYTKATDCTTINIYDNTGSYNVSTNPTGWGTPNYATANIISITLTLTLAGSSEDIDLDMSDPTSVLYYNNYLTPATGVDVDSSTYWGGAGTFPDGIMTILTTIVINDPVYGLQTVDVTRYVFWGCTIKCCIRQQTKDLTLPITDFCDVKKATLLADLYDTIEWAADTCDSDKAETLYDYAYNLCNDCGTIQSYVYNPDSSDDCGCS